MPDPATYSYTFDKISDVIEAFLKAKRFHSFGLFVQDYGGPVGFRIVGRHPDALEWLIIQNSNAYDIGLTSAWEGFRNALWNRRTPKTEKPLAAFLEHDAIKGIYLHGARREELISPDNWKSDFAFMERPMARRVQLDLFYDYRMAAVSQGPAAEDHHLLGPGRHILLAQGWRGLLEGPATGRDAPA